MVAGWNVWVTVELLSILNALETILFLDFSLYTKPCEHHNYAVKHNSSCPACTKFIKPAVARNTDPLITKLVQQQQPEELQ